QVHHPINTNPQLKPDLLQPDAGHQTSPSMQPATNRIQAIAQVHNLLSSEMPEKVDTQSLITTVVHMLTGTARPPTGPPELTLDIEHLWLTADQAVALSLIINELVSNSLVHGPPPSGAR